MPKLQKFSYDVAGLPNYTKLNPDILTATVFNASETADMVTTIDGIKNAEFVNNLTTNATWQAGGGCTFNPTGSDTFSQRTLQVGRVTIQKNYCYEDLEQYFTMFYLKQQKSLQGVSIGGDLEQLVLKQLLAQVGSDYENSLWQAIQGGNNANNSLNLYNGFLVNTQQAQGYISGNTSTMSSTTAVGLFQAFYRAIPTRLLNSHDFQAFTGYDNYNDYVTNLVNNNLFNPSAIDNTKYKFQIYGFPLWTKAVHGLDGQNVIYGAREVNMFRGIDGLSDMTNSQIWLDNNGKTTNLLLDFKTGTQISIPGDVVYWSNGG
jgi:hypothetical protein